MYNYEGREIINENFVWYNSFTQAYLEIRDVYPEVAAELADAIICYGTFGEYDESNPFVNAIMKTVGVGIDKAKERYAKSVENGTKGGRPALKIDEDKLLELKESGYTQKQIANYFNCSVDTIKRRLNDISAKTAKPQNLKEEVKEESKTNEENKEAETVAAAVAVAATVSEEEKEKYEQIKKQAELGEETAINWLYQIDKAKNKSNENYIDKIKRGYSVIFNLEDSTY